MLTESQAPEAVKVKHKSTDIGTNRQTPTYTDTHKHRQANGQVGSWTGRLDLGQAQNDMAWYVRVQISRA